VAAPEVDDGLALDVHGQGGADLGAGGEGLGEGLPERLEAARALPLDAHAAQCGSGRGVRVGYYSPVRREPA
jgi:hypothetical protein